MEQLSGRMYIAPRKARLALSSSHMDPVRSSQGLLYRADKRILTRNTDGKDIPYAEYDLRMELC
jgi:hypothetical protein